MSRDAFAYEKDFEFGIGGGNDLNAINARNLIFIPAISWTGKENAFMKIRIEGNIELIYDEQHAVTVISGIAPFLRFYPLKRTFSPFIEIGAGANVSTRREIGERKMGSTILFSLMEGAGIEYRDNQLFLSLSYRFRHLSSGNLHKDNYGINTQYLILSIGF